MLIPGWTLPLCHISSTLDVARPFTNKVEKGWKKCTDPMVGGARSITLYDTCTPSSMKVSLQKVYCRAILKSTTYQILKGAGLSPGFLVMIFSTTN